MIDSTEQSIQAARKWVASLTGKIPEATSAAQAEYACGVVEGYLKALGDNQILQWPECNRLLLDAIDAAKAWQSTSDLHGGIVSDYDPFAPERR
jgi:hypothetical protein